MRKRITQWFLRQWLPGVVVELPDIAGNQEVRRIILETAKSALENQADKYVDDLVLETVRQEITYKTKNDFDIAFNRGAAWAIHSRRERLTQLANTHATKDIPKEQPGLPSRNHG